MSILLEAGFFLILLALFCTPLLLLSRRTIRQQVAELRTRNSDWRFHYSILELWTALLCLSPVLMWIAVLLQKSIERNPDDVYVLEDYELYFAGAVALLVTQFLTMLAAKLASEIREYGTLLTLAGILAAAAIAPVILVVYLCSGLFGFLLVILYLVFTRETALTASAAAPVRASPR
ncbi:MAG TPA: hypothetical protein VEK08_10915 [Planctomycetota bacterium]|nr:hypothetical protein [Planctomycetota bacterium]